MAEDKDQQSALEQFKANLVLENVHLLSIQLKKPKLVDGTPDSAKTVLAFEFDTEKLERYFGLLSKLQRRDRPVALGFSFVEQLELPKEDQPKADKNGHGPATGGLTPIEGGKDKPKTKERAHART